MELVNNMVIALVNIGSDNSNAVNPTAQTNKEIRSALMHINRFHFINCRDEI